MAISKRAVNLRNNVHVQNIIAFVVQNANGACGNLFHIFQRNNVLKKIVDLLERSI